MVFHYLIFILISIILINKFYKVIKNSKLSRYNSNFIIKGRENNIITTVSLIFIFLCSCNLVIFIVFLIEDINYLAYKGIDFNLIDLLVPHKFNLLLEPLYEDTRDNIFEMSSLISASKCLITIIYSIIFAFVGFYFFYVNSRFIYIHEDVIYKLDNKYRLNTDKLHQWDRIFGKDILNANVIDENGRQEVINLLLYNNDKKILETLIGTECFTENTSL